jgi:cellulose synthase/poly-beta-1,6-N-acetylglucosamine synthase-like glycosyltransferase
MAIFEAPDFTNIFFLLSLAFGFVFLIQIVFYWAVFGRFAFYKRKPKGNLEYLPVSVVIVARNEYHNLNRNLPLILEQDYPNFEVVVVNDTSDDDSAELLKSFSERYKHLNVFTISSNLNFFSGKKFPLALGIKAAKNDILLLSDADCKPKSDKWIFEMQKNFTDKSKIVLGYGAYERKKGILNKLIRFDTLQVALQYFSHALIGMPYMGVGRNLSYRKNFFNNTKGFTKHYQISSGDDDLFVNQNATKSNVKIEFCAKSHTVSVPKESFSAWFRQKKRHLTTGKYYKFSDKFTLGLFSLSQLLFFVLMIILLVFRYNMIPVAALFLLRMTSQLIIFKQAINKLEEKNLLLYTPLFELFFIIVNPLVYLSNLVSKENKWK